MSHSPLHLYTDGSCDVETNIGAWAAILLLQEEKVVLSGVEKDTTHNRMELLAAINAIHHLDKTQYSASEIIVFTDSQYIVGLPARKVKLQQSNFKTKTGKLIRNDDLLKQIFELLENRNLSFTKVKAHQRKTATHNYNREVDKLVRKTLRTFLKKERH